MKKVTTLTALHVSVRSPFAFVLFVLTWWELQALLPNLFLFPKSGLPKLVFSLSTYVRLIYTDFHGIGTHDHFMQVHH